MKWKRLLIVGIFLLGIMTQVEAKENVFYTTPNGIELTKEEYHFLTTFYWKDYVDHMSLEQYEEFQNSDLLERELISTSRNDSVCQTRSDTHSTTFKTLKVSAACSNNCVISLVNTWKVNPSVRSYDVIGYYLSGLSLLSYNSATVTSSTSSNNYSNFKTEYATYHDAIGNSVPLPSGNNIVVNQIITTTTGGHIYGSYQHATQNITLPVSKSYTFSLAGYGSVFNFTGSAVGVYDGMAGVDIGV